MINREREVRGLQRVIQHIIYVLWSQLVTSTKYLLLGRFSDRGMYRGCQVQYIEEEIVLGVVMLTGKTMLWHRWGLET